MPISISADRQYPLTASVEINFGDVTPAGAYEAFDLPSGAVVVGGEIIVDTAFNSSTNTLSLGDASSATRYANAVNTQTPARTALTLTGFKTTGSQPNLIATSASTGATPTAGKVRINVSYIVTGRAQEVQD